MLNWQITDRSQTVLATLHDRRLGRVTVDRNGGRSGSVQVSLDDPAALKVLPLATLLRCYLDGALIFCGRIMTPSFADEAGAGEGGAGVTINALDPFNHLERCYTKGLAPFAAVDQSQIMWGLVNHVADRDHGVVEGMLWTGGLDRDRTYYDGKQVAEALTQMSEVLGGPDFELQPVDATDGSIARLNTFEAQGMERVAVFEYGFGQHNVIGFSWEPTGETVCNKLTAVGDPIDGNAPAYIAHSDASIALFGGTFERFEAVNDVTETITLEQYAKEQVGRYALPIDNFTLTLPPQEVGADVEPDATYGEPPVCGPDADYWIGDTITARIRRNIDVAMLGRIDAITLTEDEQGSVSASPTFSPIPSTSDVTGDSTTVQVDAPPTPTTE